MKMGVLIGFSGTTMYELIETDGTPSVYTETVNRRGYGFHHFGIASASLDSDIARYEAMGYEVAMKVSTSGGIHAAYMDGSSSLPGMIELIEIGETVSDFFREVHRFQGTWRGAMGSIKWLDQ
jgi:hypothetical protein